jgi:leucyl/phenylalanyl-tRNA---protein transferase
MMSRPPSEWTFPPLEELPPGDDLIAVGADLSVPTLLEAYASGYFPMPLGGRRLGWFSPDPRGVLPLDGLKISRSLRRSIRRYDVSVDQAFAQVVSACADPGRPHGWIDRKIQKAYSRLHELGWAHSVETWEDGELVGGLYGVVLGGLFAGESMFHRRTDASKVALVHLVELLGGTGRRDALLDVQWCTPHLASLGVIEIPRTDYGARLRQALLLQPPPTLVRMER